VTRAESLIRRAADLQPLAVRLAETVSLAVLVDPPLLRRARLDLVPGADPGTEADLWLSTLVQTRSPGGIVFPQDIAEALRLRLAEDRDRLDLAWKTTQAMHCHLTPALRLEEEIAWLSLAPATDLRAAERIEEILRSVLAAMVVGDRRGLAHWAARALPKLPSGVRLTKAARMLEAGANLRLGGDARFLRAEERTPDWLPWVAPADLPYIPIAVRLFEGAIEVDAQSNPKGNQLLLPQTDPLLLELSWIEPGGEANAVQVTLRKGAMRRVAMPAQEARLRTILGEVYHLRQAVTAPHNLRDKNADLPPRKARVFISGSSKEPKVQEIQTALYAELETSGVLVPLMDRQDLEPGDMWRARINLWVGGCDAAVMLLSPQALQSDWVFYEMALLTYRNETDPGFLVLPVYVDITPEEVAASRFHSTAMTSIQNVPGAGRTVAVIVDDVVKELAKAAYRSDSPVERQAKRLASRLDLFEKKALEEASGFIQYDLKPWLPADDVRLLLAVQLQSVGMEAAIPALMSLQYNLPAALAEPERERWLHEVTELVASSWVDYRSSDRIAEIAKAKTVRFAVGLNTSSDLTARMYVLRAGLEEPRPWMVVSCDGIVGQKTTRETIDELTAKVARAIGGALKSAPDLATVAAKLRTRNKVVSQPLFVSLPAAGISDEILTALLVTFPHVVFFLLMGEDGLSREPLLTSAMLEILFPHLVRGDEALFLEAYERFQWSIK